MLHTRVMILNLKAEPTDTNPEEIGELMGIKLKFIQSVRRNDMSIMVAIDDVSAMWTKHGNFQYFNLSIKVLVDSAVSFLESCLPLSLFENIVFLLERCVQ